MVGWFDRFRDRVEERVKYLVGKTSRNQLEQMTTKLRLVISCWASAQIQINQTYTYISFGKKRVEWPVGLWLNHTPTSTTSTNLWIRPWVWFCLHCTRKLYQIDFDTTFRPKKDMYQLCLINRYSTWQKYSTCAEDIKPTQTIITFLWRNWKNIKD